MNFQSYYRRSTLLLLVFLAGVMGGVQGRGEATGNTVGLTFIAEGASDGYTLYAPHSSQDAYLLDLQGRIVNRWTTPYFPGNAAYLLPNGHLLRSARTAEQSFPAGGRGGRIEEYDWEGNLVWGYNYVSTTHRHHHDAIKLPNGNVLLVAWELKTSEEAIAAGRDPSLITQGALWPDTLIEVEPVGLDGGNIVWEWRAWDHLVQDFDETKENFGDVAAHPELIDLNFVRSGAADWLHVNGIDYNPELDQVLIGVPFLNEIWIVDHSTTTAEAAGHTGGRSGKGGDLLYRYGNPVVYGAGTSAEGMLFGQHNPSWIPKGLPGEDHLLVFNNGQGRPGGFHTSVDEIIPPLSTNGNYTLVEGQAYGPAGPAWSYTADPPNSFYARNVSGAQRMPNGNTLICNGPAGTIFEVTSGGAKVWEYIIPVTPSGILTQGDPAPVQNLLFRAYRYTPDYPGLAGRDLTPQGTIELQPDAPFRVVDVQKNSTGVLVRWNSVTGQNYEVQHRTDLKDGTWQVIATVTAIGSAATYLDNDAERLEQGEGYYQVLALP